METIQAHTIIEGRVQGVSFRYYTQMKAHELGITGWVRNLPGGRQVEAVFCGEKSAVERMLAWCEHGPRHARVDSVAVEYQSPSEFHSFNIRY